MRTVDDVAQAKEHRVGVGQPLQRQACKDYRLRQEFITPYTPEQNGMIERFFRSLKEECVWQQRFPSFVEARRAVRRWIDWYNDQRPHQALGYLSPRQYRALQLQRVGLTAVEHSKLMAQHA